MDRQARRENYEIEEMSKDEVEEKRDEQAREVVGEEGADEDVASPAEPVEHLEGAPADLSEEGLQPPPSRLRTLEETRLEIARIESKIGSRFEGANFENFTYLHGVKIVPEEGPRRMDVTPRQVSLDGLFEAKGGGPPDVALEVKVTRLSVRSLKNRGRMFTDPLLALLARYERFTGREVQGWLLVVVPSGAERLLPRECAYVEEYFEVGLAGLGRCSVVHEEDLEQVTRVFRETFGS